MFELHIKEIAFPYSNYNLIVFFLILYSISLQKNYETNFINNIPSIHEIQQKLLSLTLLIDWTNLILNLCSINNLSKMYKEIL